MSPPSGDAFPPTRVSLLEALEAGGEVRERAWQSLAAIYWRPVYAHLRLRWGFDPPDAEDLTQEFFARAWAGGVFESYDPTRARFRTFLRTCVDHLALNERQAAMRLKRGAGRVVAMDVDAMERALNGQKRPDGEQDADRLFRGELVRALFETAVDRVRTEADDAGRRPAFEVFVAYDIDGADRVPRPTYAELAERFDVPITQVTNWLHAMRRRFRHHVLGTLRELSATEAEFRAEARDILGVDPE